MFYCHKSLSGTPVWIGAMGRIPFTLSLLVSMKCVCHGHGVQNRGFNKIHTDLCE